MRGGARHLGVRDVLLRGALGVGLLLVVLEEQRRHAEEAAQRDAQHAALRRDTTTF